MDLIILSYIADIIFGDPRWFPHPVRLIGRLISYFERMFNGKGSKTTQRFYGTLTAIVVVVVSGVCACALIKLAEKLHPLAGKIMWVLFAWITLSVKDLAVHARAVGRSLAINNIGQSRKKLSFMVGRDTQELSQDEIICATVETIAENTTDGIIAPLFYLFLGGPVLAVIFKAISTLDSMIGYKNERYLYFGRCAAKLDTLANFIPARITGLLIPLAALLSGKNFAESFRICFRDGRKRDSLNSGISEAAMAGALGIQIGGTCNYEGTIVEHPYIGEQRRPISISLIMEAVTVSIVSSLLMLVAGVLFKQIIIYLFCL